MSDIDMNRMFEILEEAEYDAWNDREQFALTELVRRLGAFGAIADSLPNMTDRVRKTGLKIFIAIQFDAMEETTT